MMETFAPECLHLWLLLLCQEGNRLFSTKSAQIQWYGFPGSSKATGQQGLLLLKQKVNRATGFLVRAEKDTMCAFSSLPLHEAFLDLSLQELRPGKGYPRGLQETPV